jgi:hypothetical protein
VITQFDVPLIGFDDGVHSIRHRERCCCGGGVIEKVMPIGAMTGSAGSGAAGGAGVARVAISERRIVDGRRWVAADDVGR